ncbi:hypothetical protein HYT23_06415 [Candidatus Pacearchaeota archaeon]|nr:hypothetical protein [Candidatus Pacearchaeota archaeon]
MTIEVQICKYCNQNVGREYGVVDLLGRPLSIEAHYKRCDERQRVLGKLPKNLAKIIGEK